MDIWKKGKGWQISDHGHCVIAYVSKSKHGKRRFADKDRDKAHEWAKAEAARIRKEGDE